MRYRPVINGNVTDRCSMKHCDDSKKTSVHADPSQDSPLRRIAKMVVWIVLRTGVTVEMVSCISCVVRNRDKSASHRGHREEVVLSSGAQAH